MSPTCECDGCCCRYDYEVAVHKMHFDCIPEEAYPDAFVAACKYGVLSMAEELVTVESVTPEYMDSDAIKWASRNGHLDVVQFLTGFESVKN